MKKSTKRWLSLTLTLVMLLGMIPAFDVAARAATTVNSWRALETAFNNGGDFKLTGNCTAPEGANCLAVPEEKTVTLDLNGYSIDATNGDEYVLDVYGSLTLRDSSESKSGKLTGGDDYVGGVFVPEGGTFTMESGAISENASSESGGGVFVEDGGTFIMNGGSIKNNTAVTYGGGVFVEGGGTFIMNGGSIENNTADEYGGGVCVAYGGTFTVNGGTISGNTVTGGGGGGVYVDQQGMFTMENGAISNNTVTGGGGGVYVEGGGTFTMKNGAISNNTANVGGGVYTGADAVFTMENGTISNNTANQSGGGVDVGSNSTFTMTYGTITGNTANQSGGGVNVANSTFKMAGGSITGNRADSGFGGGVFAEYGLFEVCGLVTITDNTGAVGYDSEIESIILGDSNYAFAPNNPELFVIGVLDNGTRIGVSDISVIFGMPMSDDNGDSDTVPFTYGLLDNGTIENFFSDSDEYIIVDVDGEAALEEKKYSVNAAEAENGTVTLDKTSAVSGEAVTVTAVPDVGYRTEDVTVCNIPTSSAELFELLSGNEVFSYAGLMDVHGYRMNFIDGQVRVGKPSSPTLISASDFTVFDDSRGKDGIYTVKTEDESASLTLFTKNEEFEKLKLEATSEDLSKYSGLYAAKYIPDMFETADGLFSLLHNGTMRGRTGLYRELGNGQTFTVTFTEKSGVKVVELVVKIMMNNQTYSQSFFIEEATLTEFDKSRADEGIYTVSTADGKRELTVYLNEFVGVVGVLLNISDSSNLAAFNGLYNYDGGITCNSLDELLSSIGSINVSAKPYYVIESYYETDTNTENGDGVTHWYIKAINGDYDQTIDALDLTVFDSSRAGAGIYTATSADGKTSITFTVSGNNCLVLVLESDNDDLAEFVGTYYGGNSADQYELIQNLKLFTEVEVTDNGNGTYSFTMVPADLTVRATFAELPTYTVTFDPNNGDEPSTRSVVEGGKATKPADPTKEGYTFGGWTLNGQDYNFSTPITADITLTAKWTRNLTHHEAVPATCTENGTIEYWEDEAGNRYSDANGETPVTDITDPAKGHDLGEPTWSWTQVGNNFTAQLKQVCSTCGDIVTTKADVTTSETDSAIIYTATATLNGETYISEKSYQKAYTLTVNGGTVDNEKDGYSYGETVVVTANETDSRGKYFSGWYKGEYKVSEKLKYAFNITDNTTLTAKYELDGEITPTPIISMTLSERTDVGSGKEKVTFVTDWTLPSGYTFVSAGIVRNYSSSENLTVEGASKVHKTSLTTPNGTYTYNLTMGTVSKVNTLYGKGFLTYTDPNGERFTIYSDLRVSEYNQYNQ